MISDRMARLLIEQIGHELKAHQLYMGIAIYFERQSLDRWGKLFRDQSVEEAEHANKLIEFLTDNAVTGYDLPALKSAGTRFTSAAEAAQAAFDSERAVTLQYEALSKTALEQSDHTTYQFLQWFVSEQVEEERKIQALQDLINSGINLFQAEPLLDRFE